MSEMGFSKSKEYLPQFDQFQKINAQRRLFLEFFNHQVCKELRFNKQEIKRCEHLPLCDVFVQKIMSLLDVSFVPFHLNGSPKIKKITSFFDNDIQKLFNMKHNTTTRAFLQQKNCSLALKLFNMIGGTNLTLKVSAQSSFEQFIVKKLLRDQKTRCIEKESDCINIISSQVDDIKIFPYWNFFEDKKECIIDEHISKAVQCIKETHYKNIYLVYPKDNHFNKHLQVKIPEFENNKLCSEYGIKIIPYSLRSILR
ncbi:hypothetical protein [Candidatus Marinarcus aquaticus]|uniref:Uncharacterized protein n=1 Tax=Candidatus Marinarcus aquaticus TaxID=2044504 RepID=A0A4Q0XUJ1_9BACT|nr:hypothetical protein [Candidatus Marinarcus aquaticus]RXJ60224.1 hypothetical protein CRV04_04270 [Candidatus Marinarcus aquaticus]